jgi:hypothetical protein
LVGLLVRRMGIYPPGEIVEMSNGEVGIIVACSPSSKLKPRVLLVLDGQKLACPERVIDLELAAVDRQQRPYRIKEVFVTGAFGIDIEAYRRKGLIIPPHL